MSEQQISVRPGVAPTTLVMALGSGSTIQNNDSANAVWVSTNAGVIAGTGTRIGPKGSLAWTTPGATVFAVVDTGVTTAVALSVSSDIAQPVNPVDIGVAVATQLLTQGVPNVLIGDVVPNPLVDFDVSQSGSISVRATVIGETLLTYSFYANDGGIQVMGSRSLSISSPGVITFTAPVSGPMCSISDSNGQISSLSVFRSNRILEEQVQAVTTAVSASPNQAWTSGTAIDLGFDVITDGGIHRCRFAVTGTGKGFLLCRVYNNTTGTFSDLPILDTGEGHVGPQAAAVTELEAQVTLPPGRHKFKFLPQVTATYQVIAQVIPTS